MRCSTSQPGQTDIRPMQLTRLSSYGTQIYSLHFIGTANTPQSCNVVQEHMYVLKVSFKDLASNQKSTGQIGPQSHADHYYSPW